MKIFVACISLALVACSHAKSSHGRRVRSGAGHGGVSGFYIPATSKGSSGSGHSFQSWGTSSNQLGSGNVNAFNFQEPLEGGSIFSPPPSSYSALASGGGADSQGWTPIVGTGASSLSSPIETFASGGFSLPVGNAGADSYGTLSTSVGADGFSIQGGNRGLASFQGFDANIGNIGNGVVGGGSLKGYDVNTGNIGNHGVNGGAGGSSFQSYIEGSSSGTNQGGNGGGSFQSYDTSTGNFGNQGGHGGAGGSSFQSYIGGSSNDSNQSINVGGNSQSYNEYAGNVGNQGGNGGAGGGSFQSYGGGSGSDSNHGGNVGGNFQNYNEFAGNVGNQGVNGGAGGGSFQSYGASAGDIGHQLGNEGIGGSSFQDYNANTISSQGGNEGASGYSFPSFSEGLLGSNIRYGRGASGRSVQGSSLGGYQQVPVGFQTSEGRNVDSKLLEEIRSVLFREESSRGFGGGFVPSASVPSTAYGTPSSAYGVPGSRGFGGGRSGRVVGVVLEGINQSIQVAQFHQTSSSLTGPSHTSNTLVVPSSTYGAPY